MMRCAYKKQTGAVTVIAAVLFLAIVGIMSIVVNNISGTMLTDANTGDQGAQLEMIAESGLERAFYQLKKGGTTCTAIADVTRYMVGIGTFEITGGVLTGSTCQVTVMARPASGDSSRTLTGSISVGYSITEHFPTASVWSVPVFTQNRGTYSYPTTGCPISTCPLAAYGSLEFATSTSGSGNQYIGYMQRSIDALSTGASGANMRWDVGLAKDHQGNGTNGQTIRVSLIASATGTETFLVTDSTTAKGGTWYRTSGTTALTANKTYDTLRVYFGLRDLKSFQNKVSIDEIQLNSP